MILQKSILFLTFLTFLTFFFNTINNIQNLAGMKLLSKGGSKSSLLLKRYLFLGTWHK